MGKYKTQIDNVENNLVIIINEISNIQERIAYNENNYGQLVKTIKTEYMSMKKVVTEMINIRFSVFEKTLKEWVDVVMPKLTGMENENAELKEKLNEIQTKLSE
jgi:transposase-like protein